MQQADAEADDLTIGNREPTKNRRCRIEHALPCSRRYDLRNAGFVKSVVLRPQLSPGRFIGGQRVAYEYRRRRHQAEFSASINRCLMAWPSRMGSTRGTSSSLMRALTRIGPSPLCSNLRTSGASSMREIARAYLKRQPSATATRSMPALVWLPCIPVSPEW